MIEMRFHGRGGQGTVTATEILANALFLEGKYAQAFPKFGVERQGAPVETYVRINEKPVLLRTQIYFPDYVVVLNTSLFKEVNVTAGLKTGGWLIINTPKDRADFPEFSDFRMAFIDATKIAILQKIGTKTSPITNTVILGAVAKILGLPLPSLIQSIKDSGKIKNLERNIQGLKIAYQEVKIGGNDEK